MPLRDPLRHPLRCRPLLKPKVWGGRDLETILGKPLPPGEPIGESWEVADISQGTSAIDEGPLADLTLREVMAQFGERLFPGWGIEEFPLLVKFLDAQEDISIQVHPHAEACRELFPSERSKNETWLIVHAESGGAILHGTQRGVTEDEARRRIADGSIMDVMRRVEVTPGDVIHLPAGTLHAMLRGVILLEIQEPSDSTFRVYDHDRVGLDGLPRDLHVEEALACLLPNDDASPVIIPDVEACGWGQRELLVDIAPYRVERLKLCDDMPWQAQSDSAQVMVVLAGTVEMELAEGALTLRRGDTAILPPGLPLISLRPHDLAQVVLASPRPPVKP